jgi:hypothetical protein
MVYLLSIKKIQKSDVTSVKKKKTDHMKKDCMKYIIWKNKASNTLHKVRVNKVIQENQESENEAALCFMTAEYSQH